MDCYTSSKNTALSRIERPQNARLAAGGGGKVKRAMGDKLRRQPGKAARFQRLHRNGTRREVFADASEFCRDARNEQVVFRATAGEIDHARVARSGD